MVGFSAAMVSLVITSAFSHKKSFISGEISRIYSGRCTPFFSTLKYGPSICKPSAWFLCLFKYSRIIFTALLIPSSGAVIKVGKKLVQPDFRLVACMISKVSTLVWSLNITPPQPFNCKSIKPAVRLCPCKSRVSMPLSNSLCGITASMVSPLITTA